MFGSRGLTQPAERPLPASRPAGQPARGQGRPGYRLSPLRALGELVPDLLQRAPAEPGAEAGVRHLRGAGHAAGAQGLDASTQAAPTAHPTASALGTKQ